jgi:hypothetical protein
MLLDAEAAAAAVAADSLAGITGHALGSPRQHSKSSSLHQHAGSFRSCSSCSVPHNNVASGSNEAAAAVEEVLEELTAAVEGSSKQQQQQQQEAEQQLEVGSSVPRPVGAMLYPGRSTPMLLNAHHVMMR